MLRHEAFGHFVIGYITSFGCCPKPVFQSQLAPFANKSAAQENCTTVLGQFCTFVHPALLSSNPMHAPVIGS